MSLKTISLIRHAATDWSESGQHTGLTDLSLNAHGQKEAKQLRDKLKQETFDHVFCSPLKRAVQTCEICEYEPELDADLVEWNYGAYEGLTYDQIHRKNPDWELFKDGAPEGESVEQIAQRARRFLNKIHSLDGDIAIFSSGHFLRVLATQWIHIPATFGRALYLSTSSISLLGFERQTPVIIRWNDILR